MLSVSLDDKYTATTGRIYLSGIQALVRLMLQQQQRDAAAGLKTAAFVSATAALRWAGSTKRYGRPSRT